MQHGRSSVQLKTYRVACWRTHYGFYDVEAKDELEATTKAYQRLWNGEEMDGRKDMDAGIADTQEL
jgi:hypothetical protein